MSSSSGFTGSGSSGTHSRVAGAHKLSGIISSIHGEAYAKLADGRVVPLHAGDVVTEGTTVHVAGGGRATLVRPDGGAVDLGGGRDIAVTGDVLNPHAPSTDEVAAPRNPLATTAPDGSDLSRLLPPPAAGDPPSSPCVNV